MLIDTQVNPSIKINQIKEYWLKKLSGFESKIELPMDFPRSSANKYLESKIQSTYSNELYSQLGNISNKEKKERAVILLAAKILWTYFNTNEAQQLFGHTVYESSQKEPVLLPFVITLDKNYTISNLLDVVKEHVAMDNQHRDISFSDLKETFMQVNGKKGETKYLSVFHMKIVNDNNRANVSDSLLSATDLLWNFDLDDNQIHVEIIFNSNIYKEESVSRFNEQYKRILELFSPANLSVPLHKLDFRSDEEKDLYQQLNKTAVFYEKEKTISQLFDESVTKYPYNVALSDENAQLTYLELNERSNEIAHMLMENGMKQGEFVAILMERSVETVISLLGILKAGGVYVPIDPTYPEERCSFLLKDTKAKYIMTKSKYKKLLNQLLLESSICENIFYLDIPIGNYSKENVISTLKADDLAYVIYTSGSTGQPKGTLIKHGAVVNLITDLQRIYETTEKDVFTQFISYSFDPSVTETFMSFFSGAKLHLLTETERLSVEEFANAVERVNATHATLPNAFFKQLALHLPKESEGKIRSLISISVGGEMLMSSIVQKWQEKFGTQITIMNVYGPTECTVLSTIYRITDYVESSQSSIPIGQPIGNYEVYIVNKNNQLCPVNVPGELLIGGSGLAAGYLNQPEKTEETFISHHFSDLPGKKLYKTGDIVRLLPNGMIEFIDRQDSQVKVRGYRIELGEVESALVKLPLIVEAVVIAKKLEDGNNQLFTYFTGKNNQQLSKESIRYQLEEYLPSYMIPDQFIQLDALPLSPTGKIDRKQLADRNDTLSSGEHFEAPRNVNEQILAEAWQKVLKLELVGIHDDFFLIGGHSLKILEVLVQVKRHFPFLKIQDFFEYRTIAALNVYIEEYGVRREEVQVKKEKWTVKDLAEPPLLISEFVVNPSKPFSKAVLLTGATGFLGSHVLYELLQKTTVTIFCLIRKNSHYSIVSKLKESLQFYFSEDVTELLDKRVIAIQGDLGEENLGLNSLEQTRLCVEIGTIIHCGADVRHFGNVEQFERVNVEGTRCLLNLAKQGKGIHFHHVSTLSIPEELASCGQWEHYQSAGDFNYEAALENVYSQSKLKAESIVRDAIKTGIIATIYRVGNLTSHSKTGKFQRNQDDNAFYRMIKAMLYLQKTPEANWYVDFTPIDYASGALVTLVNQANTMGRTFHLCNPHQITYSTFIDYLQEQGYQLEVVESKSYEEFLLNGEHAEEMHEYLSLAIAQLEGDGPRDSEFRFKCEVAQQFLSESGVQCVEPNQDYIRTMIQYGVNTGYFPKPAICKDKRQIVKSLR